MIAIFISLVLIALLIFLYLKEHKTAGYKAPTIFRIIILVLLILIILGNIFKFSYRQSPKVPLLVLVDASKSINVGDNLLKIKQVIDKIKQEPLRKKFFSFTDSIGPLENYEQAAGSRTDISQALSFAQKHRPGSIILISDGQHNTNSDPMMIARMLSAPIYTIGIGAEQKQDIAIKSIRKPLRSFLLDTIDITIRVQSRGFENQKVKVSLQHKGKAVTSKEILIAGNDVIQEINFRVSPETIGQQSFRIKIDNLPNEATYTNNEQDFIIEILKNRWQILYLTNSPSFNSRFMIMNLEKSDGEQANFNVIPIIALSGREFKISKDISIETAFQNSDVIILDNVDESLLSSNIINYLRNQLDQPKGILILGGESFKPQSLIKDIAPFEFTTTRADKKDIFLQLTESGATTPIFFNEQNEYLLANTPPLFGINIAQSLKPDAILWAMTKDDQKPLIGFRLYKNTKIVFIAGFPIWRLGFSSFETEKTKLKFEQFLKNLLRFLAIKDFEPFKLLTDKPTYLTGEEIVFNLFAATPDGRNWSDLDIKLEIPTMKTSLILYETSPGSYEGDANALMPGEFQALAQISKDGKSIGSAKTTFSVTEQSIEDITGLNAELLTKLSNATQGKYYTAEEFSEATFTPNIIKYQRTINFSFRHNLYIYLIITALFGIALFLRKKRGFL